MTRRRAASALAGLVAGGLLFRFAAARSAFDAALAVACAGIGAAIGLGGLRPRARVLVGVLAAAGAVAAVLALHEALRGERRDEGPDPLVPVADARIARLEQAWVLEGGEGRATIRVRALGPSPRLELAPGARAAVAWENVLPTRMPRRRPWRFAAWGDARGGADVFAQARDAIAARDVAFSVGLGDLVGMARRYQLEILRDRMEETGRPAFFVPGNHDLDPFGTLRPYARVLGPPRWSFVEDRVLFVGLDSSRGALSDEDAAWAERAIEERGDATEVVLCCHHPLFPPAGRPDKALPQGAPSTRRVQDAARRARALCLSGNWHAFDRAEHGGATQVVTGGAGSPLEGPGGHHVVVVTVGAGGLAVEKVDVASADDASPAWARVTTLREEAAWVAAAWPLRFAGTWALVAVALGALFSLLVPAAAPAPPAPPPLAPPR